ncbi:MAG: helix-turn-helix domain-containing protein [Chloroflexi bacterium]|nr:helix-turn-helix domain-containing protein [Chloroflexota bacterium]
MNVEIIKEGGSPAYAVLPYDDYIQLTEKLEDLEDIQAADEVSYRIKSGQEETIPAHVVRELVDSERPLRIWRKYRGLTQQNLADQIGISKSYYSQIESGNRSGSIAALKRIATALNISLDDIV